MTSNSIELFVGLLQVRSATIGYLVICFFLKDVHGALQNWQWMLGSAAAPSLFSAR